MKKFIMATAALLCTLPAIQATETTIKNDYGYDIKVVLYTEAGKALEGTQRTIKPGTTETFSFSPSTATVSASSDRRDAQGEAVITRIPFEELDSRKIEGGSYTFKPSTYMDHNTHSVPMLALIKN